MTYVFPAIFTPDHGGYAAAFPDVDGACTCGDTLPEAMAMAEDALCLVLMAMEDAGRPIPAPSAKVTPEDGAIVRLITADVDAYRRKMGAASL